MQQKHTHNWVAKENKRLYCSNCGIDKKENMKTQFSFSQAYGGGIRADVKVKGEWYVLNFDNIEEVLTRMIKIYGYTVSKTNRQKYPRLIINSL